MKTVTYYRHWYKDQYGEDVCSGWVSQDWHTFLDSNHRGKTSEVELRKTDEKDMSQRHDMETEEFSRIQDALEEEDITQKFCEKHELNMSSLNPTRS